MHASATVPEVRPTGATHRLTNPTAADFEPKNCLELYICQSSAQFQMRQRPLMRALMIRLLNEQNLSAWLQQRKAFEAPALGFRTSEKQGETC
jgi:hypothetical protein